MKYVQVFNDEWIEPRPQQGHRMKCCDCALVHIIDFRVINGRVQFRPRRDNRATAAARRKGNVMYRQKEPDDDPREATMNLHTKRRKRRRANAKLRNGKSAVRAHRRKTGRTGQIQSKKTPSKRVTYRKTRTNPPGPCIFDVGGQLG